MSVFKEIPAPSRPAIPTAFLCLAATLWAERLVLGGNVGGARAFVGGAAASLALLAARLLCSRLGKEALGCALSAAALAALAFAAGGLTGGASYTRIAAAQQALGSRPVSTLQLRLESDMSKGASLWRGRASVRLDGKPVGDVWLQADSDLACGATIGCVGRFTANGEDEWGRSSRMQGVCGTVRAVRVTSVSQAEGFEGMLLAARREALRGILGYEVGVSLSTSNNNASGAGTPAGESGLLSSGDHEFGDDSAAGSRAVVAGIVCGYVPALKQEGLSDLFSVCGISHMVAVSGSHLVVVSSIAGLLLSRVRLPRWSKAVLLALFSGAFVVFCGSPPSAARSWIMSMIATAAPLAGRRGHTLSSVSVAGLVMCLLDPTVSGQLGYLLSVACVAGIALFGGYAKHVLLVLAGSGRPFWVSRLPDKARVAVGHAWVACLETLSLTLVCQAASLPITVPAFGVVSLIAPLTNLLVAPLFAPYLTLGLLMVLVQPLQQLQTVLLGLSDTVGRAFLALLRRLAAVPGASIAVDADESTALIITCVFAAALLVAWPKVTRARLAGVIGSVAVAVMVWSLRWRLFAPARVCVMDVGQADAILVTDGAASMMVDSGVDDAVRSALSRNHVRYLDVIVLTHLDEDHVGGLDDIAGTVRVGRVLVAKGVAANMPSELKRTVRDLTGADPEEIAYGDVVCCGDFRARVVWPTSEVDGDENADSIELALTYSRGGDSLTALLTGDGEKDETGAVLAAGDVGDIDFLKVGHHGSAASLTEDIAAALRAEVAVASAGEGNRYGHPRDECVGALESAGAEFLCTKDVGDVTVYPGADGPRVFCRRGGGQGV